MNDSFRRACLVVAVIAGCGYCAFQILHDVRMPVELLPGFAARVNGHSIDIDSVNRTVAGMDARMRRSEAAARHDVLSRMIDEELLVQHALDSGAGEIPDLAGVHELVAAEALRAGDAVVVATGIQRRSGDGAARRCGYRGGGNHQRRQVGARHPVPREQGGICASAALLAVGLAWFLTRAF